MDWRVLVVGVAVLAIGGRPVQAWEPAVGPLKTRWAADVSADRAHREYPRPQMERKEWLNLNGLWSLAITAKEAPQPDLFPHQILVPFPVESALSGVMKPVTERDRLWYRREFAIPKKWLGRRVLLHFGAVDFEAVVYVNGKEMACHRGGYDAFSIDVTDALHGAGLNELVVSVWDPTDAGTQPRGKQVRKPGGIWYTPTSGIWQTVWVEPVSAAHISRLKITSDIDRGTVSVRAYTTARLGEPTVTVAVKEGHKTSVSGRGSPGQEITLGIKRPRLWSPESPFLYTLVVSLKIGNRTLDEVESYVGMRKISLGKDAKGFTRLMLNNEAYFQNGLLDQGFWPDGLYTAPTDEALRYDIEMTKKLGFNLARKHVKIEPERWYYWCDKLGLLVWQDMPSGEKYIRPNAPDISRSPESAAQYEAELKALIEGRWNHPSIVMWVPYNEGWGQWDTGRIVDQIKQRDPTRLVNNASGWTDRGVGDVNDLHKYPGPGCPAPESKRAAVLGEYGGLGLPVRGHTWQSEKNWGYRSYTNSEALTSAYVDLASKLFPLIGESGLSAAVYTQTTDVEVEVNGLMTYDRELVKMDIKRISEANRGQVPPRPRLTELVPSAQSERVVWRYRTEPPGSDWIHPGFDATGWAQGPAGFGRPETPGGVVRTPWQSGEIWLRREFDLADAQTSTVQLLIHHDEDAEVYLNGVLAFKGSGYTRQYQTYDLNPEARAVLKASGNVMAVHCRQTRGGQYIDAGLVSVQVP